MPSNPDLLQGLQFGYTPRTPRTAGSAGSNHTVEASAGGRPVGRIEWDHNSEIRKVWTEPDMRRNGVATALYGEARQHDPAVRHSTDRTREGNSWAKSVGGRLPKLTLMKSMHDKDGKAPKNGGRTFGKGR